MKRLSAKVVGLGEKKNTDGKFWTKNGFGQLKGLLW